MIGQVSQIFITDSDESVPGPLEISSNTVKEFSKINNYSYQLFEKQKIKKLIRENFDPIVTETFDALIPYAYKSDLGRYCILYIKGGWYFDMGIEINSYFSIDNSINSIFFRDIQKNSQSSWSVSNGMIYSKPQNELFLTAIKMVVDNYRNKNYGITPLCPTGPTLFGRAIAIHGLTEKNIFGDLMHLTPQHNIKNTAFVLPNGIIVAWGKKAEGGDLSALGVVGANNYNELWQERKIYRET